MKKYILGLALLGTTLSSCTDFFEAGSTHVIYADHNHLNVASDTIYSMIGILNRLQAIGDRTVLLGEVRGDLMDVTENTSSDLRDVAMFNVGDDNEYNVPRDYYAIINNCNYYIANADTALKNNRNQYLFRAEYVAAKAIRAWTYLQLVTTYGRVPFVTEPILTKEDSEKDYPMYDIKQVCDYFIFEDGLDALVDEEYPTYGNIKGIPSKLFYIPMRLVLGDLNLWAGNYLTAAMYYYDYMYKSNTSHLYPTYTRGVRWVSSTWTGWFSSYNSSFIDESNSLSSELIFMIPGDSIPSEGYYSELRGLVNTSSDNNYQISLTPSQSLIDLSAAQDYCFYQGNGDYIIAPKTLDDYQSGDLRLSQVWSTKENQYNTTTNTRYTQQSIAKYQTRNIHLYRRQLVYLRLAEAMNCAGYPHFAFYVLSTGINNKIVQDSIRPYYNNPADSAVLSYFDFPNTLYDIIDPTVDLNRFNDDGNTQGIHSRGSGYTQFNELYRMPNDTTIADSAQLRAWQMQKVEDLIVDEEALEFAFEGYRYYDLLRVALRRSATDPNYLSDKIKNRRSGSDTGITADLTDMHNWFLHWNNQIGY